MGRQFLVLSLAALWWPAPFSQLAGLEARVGIREERRGRLEGAAARAGGRSRVGRVVQAAVLRATLEKTSVDERLSSLRGDRHMQASRFNALQPQPAEA